MKTISAIAEGIHREALEVVKRYKRAEVELIEILQKADNHKIHYSLGYSSLFKYATDGLGLSEEVSYIYINVARKSKEVPQLKDEIKSGAISVSKAQRIASVLNSNNQKQWLGLAKSVSKRELERRVAAVSPKAAVREKMEFVNPLDEVKEKVSVKSVPAQQVRVQLQVGVSEKLMLKIRRAQDVLSQKLKRPASLEEVLEQMCAEFLRRSDPVEKAKRQEIRGKLQKRELCPGTVERPDSSRRSACSGSSEGPNHTPQSEPRQSLRKPLKAQIKHQLILKHNGQCAHIDESGRRCQQRRHLDVHHILEVAKGGTNEVSNLTLLCYGHHRAAHVIDKN